MSSSPSWRIKLPHLEAATFEAALASHREALITAWKHDRAKSEPALRERAADAG